MSALEQVIALAKKNKAAILSHHEPKEYYRTIKIGGNHFCTRCTGIYAGFATCSTLVALGLIPNELVNFIVFLFPLPATIDWGAYKLAGYRGSNMVRIVGGFLMGFAYITMIWLLLNNLADWRVYASAVMFGCWTLFVVLKTNSLK